MEEKRGIILKKAGVTVIVLILVILGGWLILRPRQTTTAKPVTATSTKVKKSSSLASSSSSVSSKVTKSSSSSHSESVDKSNVRTTKDKPATTTTQQAGVDTKNLTTEQVNEWVWSDLQSNYAGKGMTIHDFLFETEMKNDGLVYIDVRENHDTEDMKAQGADPHVNPMIAYYRISNQGYLENSGDAGVHWDVVSRAYQN